MSCIDVRLNTVKLMVVTKDISGFVHKVHKNLCKDSQLCIYLCRGYGRGFNALHSENYVQKRRHLCKIINGNFSHLFGKTGIKHTTFINC